MGNPKYSYDILPDESFDIYISDISQRFSFDPLSKIICADQQVLFVSKCFKERTYNIQTPLSKRPRAGKRIKNSSRLVNVWSESLTLVTFFNIFLRFFLHAYPPISLRNGPGGIRIFPLCGFRRFLRVVPLEVILISRDVHKVDMAQKTNVYTTFCPWTTKIKELSFVFSQLSLSP